jgi:hypothetical protein
MHGADGGDMYKTRMERSARKPEPRRPLYGMSCLATPYSDQNGRPGQCQKAQSSIISVLSASIRVFTLLLSTFSPRTILKNQNIFRVISPSATLYKVKTKKYFTANRPRPDAKYIQGLGV